MRERNRIAHLGKKHSVATRRKMSEIHKKLYSTVADKLKNTGRTRFKEGMVPWNKGKKGVMPKPWNSGRNLSKECDVCFTRYRVPLCRKDSKFCSRKCMGIFNMTGEKNPNWIGGGWLKVRKEILIEQDYVCQSCGLREPDIMEVNHKLERAIYPELSRDKNNLEVLCPNCHRRKTNLFLKRKE